MGICLSNEIKAETTIFTGTGVGSRNVSGNGTETSNSNSKVSSGSVPPTPRSEGEILQSSNLRSFTFNELRASTRNFRPDSVLGEGGFGSVFKGWVDEQTLLASKPGSGIVIAVKKLNQEGLQGHREWLAEINYLGQLRHPNLVRLVGYCLEDDHRLLVYEFMPKGSMENHLFRNSSVELPPELCSLIMSPLSISTLNTYSYVPLIMHRIESLIMASKLKRMHLDHCTLNVLIPTAKILEAMTTKKCLEKFHLESLETLGDSFLKYAASIQLFKTYENDHQGLLTVKRKQSISNAALCKLGCARKIPGFIRNEPFNLKAWIIPGNNSQVHSFDEEFLTSSDKMYSRVKQKIKSKRVADVVEALIGAYLSSGGEVAALSFMKWLGVDINFVDAPMSRHFPMNAEKLVNVRYLESLLHYKFNDPSLLVEALTHGSYMLPEIPRSYQRLEFLGDAVLDYVVTTHLYFKYQGLTPGLITDLRSASVNNECYALSAVKACLHKHILHDSQDLLRHIFSTVEDFEKLDLVSTFGWEVEAAFPKVLADVIESLAGAIFVDSGFNKDTAFQSISPLLEPLITPQTLKLHPARELNELCAQKGYIKKKNVDFRENGIVYITVEVEANGAIHKDTHSGRNEKMAKKVASKKVLKSLKEYPYNA